MAPAMKLRSIRSLSSVDAQLLLLVLIWAGNFTVMKHVFTEMYPMSFNAIRFPLAALTLLFLTLIGEGNLSFSRSDLPGLLGLGVVGHAGYQTFFLLGLGLSTASSAALILGTTPIWVGVLNHLFRLEAMSRSAWIGVLLSFSGVALIIRSSEAVLGFTGNALIGDIMVLAGTLCWAAYTVFSKPFLRNYSPTKLNALTMAFGTPILLLTTIPSIELQDWNRVTWWGWSSLVYSFGMSLVVAYLIWYNAVSRVGTTRTAVYSNLIPIVGAAVAWIFLGEKITSPMLFGAGLVFSGIYITRRFSPKLRLGV